MQKVQYSMAYRALAIFLYALIYFNVIYCIFYFEDYLSYDLKHYIAFFKELEPLTASNFFVNLISNFPYFQWGYSGKFEFGFSIISYFFVNIFNEYIAYAAILSISMLIKIAILYKTKTNIVIAAGVLFLSSTLFETNMLRAGIAASLLMLAIYFRIKGRSTVFVALMLSAPMFHLSASFYVLIYIFSSIFKKIAFNKIFFIFYLSGIFVATYNLDAIFQMAGGKLGDYYIQAKVYGLYGGASGFNTLTLSLFLLSVGLYYSLKGKKEITDIDIFFIYSATTLLLVGLFSGAFSIIFDRLSQLYLVMIPVYLMFLRFPQTNQNSFCAQILSLRFNIKDAAILLFLAMFVYYSYYLIIFQYPQSNVYYFANGVREYDSPVLQ